MRGFTLIALIFPNVLGLETSLAGLAKLDQLKTLKTSQRNTMVGFLAQPRALDERHVDIALARPSENVPSQVAEDRPATADGKPSIDQAAIRNECRGNKDVRVEEPIDAAAHTALQNRILQRLPRRQTSCGEVRGRPEERACGTVEEY